MGTTENAIPQVQHTSFFLIISARLLLTLSRIFVVDFQGYLYYQKAKKACCLFPFSAIENSHADIPVVSSSEAEQSEPDCDIGGTLEADPQSEPSSFVSPPER